MIFTLLNPSRKEKTLKEERKRNGEKLKTMEILLYTERERREPHSSRIRKRLFQV
jgi:hypothetical protein